MSLVALDGMPLVAIGAPNRVGTPLTAGVSNTLIDATTEAVIMVGRIYTEDGGSHTIDTTGSSSLGWRSGGVTFANAGTTVTVGLAAVDATGPAVRAVNATDVITFDVAAVFTGGGGGITANAWQTSVPTTGTKTVANGDLVAFCVQATARAGADLVNVQCTGAPVVASVRPSVTGFVGGAYANQALLPNAVITFSDGIMGWFVGGYVALTGTTTQTWNNTSGTKEYGNFLQFPFPTRVYGVRAGAAVSADLDFVLYSDPLGTPVAEKTLSIDANTVSTASNGTIEEWFSSTYDIPANTPVAIVAKPTSASNVSVNYLTLHASAHQKTINNGTNGYAVSRNAGAFAAVNSSKDRFGIALLVGAFDSGGGAAGGLLRHPGLDGGLV